MSTVAERVSAGIQLLDEKVPDWRDRIDISRLDIKNTRNCILGQVFGIDPDSQESGYDAGVKILHLDEDCDCCSGDDAMTASQHGFDAIFGIDSIAITIQFQELQKEWERHLTPVSA